LFCGHQAAEREKMLARTYVATHNHNRTRAVTTAALGTKERLQAAADKDQADDGRWMRKYTFYESSRVRDHLSAKTAGCMSCIKQRRI
jgi:hypothetical protein